VLHKIPKWFLGPHFAPQEYILNQSSTRGKVKTFRLEKDIGALRQFLEPYGLILPHMNRTRQDYDYRTFYDAETFEWVRQVYIRDIASFGYGEECLTLERFVHGDTQENLRR
jgi:hypothetical protein